MFVCCCLGPGAPWRKAFATTARRGRAGAACVQEKVAETRTASGIQPRGSRHPRLLPEHKQHLRVVGDFSPADPRVVPGHKWEQSRLHGIMIPQGAVTVRTDWSGEVGVPNFDGKPPARACLREIGNLVPTDVYIGREHKGRNGKWLARSRWANPFHLRDC